jgi:hypothetical protein
MENNIEKYNIYRHKSGELYIVTDISTHCLTMETMVVYQNLRSRWFSKVKGEKSWVRPESSFKSLFTFVRRFEMNEMKLEIMSKNHWELLNTNKDNYEEISPS